MVRRIAKVFAVLAVVIVAAIFLLPTFAAQDGRSLRTSILVGTSGGEVLHFEEGTNFLGLPQISIVDIGGVSISYIRWLTDYQATSPDYSQYSIISPSSVKVELFYVRSTSPPDFPSCGVLVDDQITVAGNFDVATWYSIGETFMGRTAPNDETVKITAAEINAAANSGCMTGGTGISFFLKYTITVSVQAIGEGPTPTDTVQELVTTTLSIELGSITGVTDTTVSSG